VVMSVAILEGPLDPLTSIVGCDGSCDCGNSYCTPVAQSSCNNSCPKHGQSILETAFMPPFRSKLSLKPLGTLDAKNCSDKIIWVKPETKNMKRKIILLTLGGLLAGTLAVSAQHNTAAAETAKETNTAVTNAVPQLETAATSTTNVAPETVTQPVTSSEATAVVAPAATVALSESIPTIPLIVMDEVPLTDAVKNLARQANINYMLDPRIAFGQVGPDGKVIPQPVVSIRWENVTAEQALYALLNNYNLQLVSDSKTKIARVTVKDPAAPDPLETRIIQLKFASPSNVLVAVHSLLTDKRSKVVGDIRTSQLVVLATEKEMTEIQQTVERLDTRTKQVLIEAKLVETSINPSTIKGLDWRGTLSAQNIAFGNNLQANSPSASVNPTLSKSFPKLLLDTAHGFNPSTAFLDADGVNAVFSFMNQDSEARVVSTPRTVTLDNEKATLSVTRATPIIYVSAGSAITTGGSQITYTNLGVLLEVTPRISANDFINLHVIPEVSRVFDTVTKVVSGATFQADQYDIRKMETRVMIPSGNTLVLGGLVQDDNRKSSTKVPMLGDIPFLGKAFQSKSKSQQKNNLLVFITPTIVQDNDYQPNKTDYLKIRIPKDEATKWSSWDSTKPHDWSKSSSPGEFQDLSSK
jgi:type II secretory pathway component GspD/PulD (secretin)